MTGRGSAGGSAGTSVFLSSTLQHCKAAVLPMVMVVLCLPPLDSKPLQSISSLLRTRSLLETQKGPGPFHTWTMHMGVSENRGP